MAEILVFVDSFKSTAPALHGDAILVPDLNPVTFPGKVEMMFDPGAQMSTQLP